MIVGIYLVVIVQLAQLDLKTWKLFCFIMDLGNISNWHYLQMEDK